MLAAKREAVCIFIFWLVYQQFLYITKAAATGQIPPEQSNLNKGHIL